MRAEILIRTNDKRLSVRQDLTIPVINVAGRGGSFYDEGMERRMFVA